MNKLPKIKEMIVVEGRSDTQNLSRAVIADTIETGGSAVNDDAIERAKLAADTRGIIILTDPDFNGQRIRHIVSEAVPTAKQAYLTVNEARAAKDNPHKSLGVEHATPQALQTALANVITPMDDTYNQSDIDRLFLIQLGLLSGPEARLKRELVGEKLHIGYTNGKQLLKRLQAFGIRRAQVKSVLEGEF
ncbi:ribonuclease M5 [Leuconostoc litchii]|uniref:Ribonuclease M5 n=1 Tax=Leuconostoc litchii TaxID=1981069 RepID=A0A652NDN1_9LACO|nr:ribonuclease M5 [Leuconostoc litchii]TYC46011.1 ribonuclease M5 [Leuconostoc litchii]GMA70280.1 ribonuclease M5 [Leuconostoc litchii]